MIAIFLTLVLFLLWKSNVIKCEFGWVFAPIIIECGILFIPLFLIISLGFDYLDIENILSIIFVPFVAILIVFILMLSSYKNEKK